LKNHHMRIVFALFVVLVFSCSVAFAWSGAGHMTVAAIAYGELSADEKHKVSNLLTHHPDYSKWTNKFSAELAPIDLETFVFMRASTWPDEIRRRGNEYDHPEWHYIDYPLEPPLFPDKPSPFPNNDILYGIAECEHTLTNRNALIEVRAAYLSWLIHLVGDIHQPLHCSTLVNADYEEPIGDKGGNSFFVKPNTAGVNLHSIWDKALGASVNYRSQFNYATRIVADNSRANLAELSKDLTPQSWSKESRAIAIENAYLHGNLHGGKTAATAIPLPEDYTRNLKMIAERQAALAGFRLAGEIKRFVR